MIAAPGLKNRGSPQDRCELMPRGAIRVSCSIWALWNHARVRGTINGSVEFALRRLLQVRREVSMTRRVHRALGMATRTQASEFSASPLVDQGFCDGAARGLIGAQKEHVVGSVRHPSLRIGEYLPRRRSRTSRLATSGLRHSREFHAYAR